jgi:hypothetical protein
MLRQSQRGGGRNLSFLGLRAAKGWKSFAAFDALFTTLLVKSF